MQVAARRAAQLGFVSDVSVTSGPRYGLPMLESSPGYMLDYSRYSSSLTFKGTGHLLRKGTGGRSSVSGIIATVFGATGFLGRYVVQQLAKVGSQVLVPFRGSEDSPRHLKLMGDLGQIVPMKYNPRDESSIKAVMAKSNVVINLIGREYETRNFSFEDVNIEISERLAKIAKEHGGIMRFIQVSCLGASLSSSSRMQRTKAAAEEIILKEIPEVSSCICTMVRDNILRGRILKDIEMYKKSMGYFGFSGAIETRGDLSLDVWWTNFGGDTPDLQNLAIRILSQTCSSSGCERNWSAFDKIHSKKRNRLMTDCLNDLVYIYVNLRLYVRQLQRTENVESIDLSTIEPTYSDAPLCDIMEDDNVDDEFRAQWIDLEDEIDVAIGMAVDDDEEEEFQPEEEEHVHMGVEDPLPPVVVDVRGKGIAHPSSSDSPITPSGSRAATSRFSSGRYKRGRGL